MNDRIAREINYIARMALGETTVARSATHWEEGVVFDWNFQESVKETVPIDFLNVRQFEPSGQRLISVILRSRYLLGRFDYRAAFTKDAIGQGSN
jgi:hypothetical protein